MKLATALVLLFLSPLSSSIPVPPPYFDFNVCSLASQSFTGVILEPSSTSTYSITRCVAGQPQYSTPTFSQPISWGTPFCTDDGQTCFLFVCRQDHPSCSDLDGYKPHTDSMLEPTSSKSSWIGGIFLCPGSDSDCALQTAKPLWPLISIVSKIASEDYQQDEQREIIVSYDINSRNPTIPHDIDISLPLYWGDLMKNQYQNHNPQHGSYSSNSQKVFDLYCKYVQDCLVSVKQLTASGISKLAQIGDELFFVPSTHSFNKHTALMGFDSNKASGLDGDGFEYKALYQPGSSSHSGDEQNSQITVIDQFENYIDSSHLHLNYRLTHSHISYRFTQRIYNAFSRFFSSVKVSDGTVEITTSVMNERGQTVDVEKRIGWDESAALSETMVL